jgi:hypothetical protein
MDFRGKLATGWLSGVPLDAAYRDSQVASLN